jgi:2-amino-4-hydroxy-6-hydroxymethyldihydropteridine diphosphokinase
VSEPATRVLVGLGSNEGEREAHLEEALRALGRLPDTRLLARSAWRETAPVACPPGSGPFLNGACLIETAVPPRELLVATRRIEQDAGRRGTRRNAPRPLDLDLLLYGERVVVEPGLVVPHPRAHERLFVLEPAVEVAPRMRHPVLRRTLEQLLADLRQRARGDDAGTPATDGGSHDAPSEPAR